MQHPKIKQFKVEAVENTATPAHSLSYAEWGDQDNPEIIICVHGLTRNGRDFDYLASHLATNYRVICPDMAGRGKSEWFEDYHCYNYITYVNDMLALLKFLGNKPVDWIGTSMGGVIGMMIAANKLLGFQAIKKFVINDIGPFVPASGLQRISKYVGHHPRFVNLAEAEKYLRVVLSTFGISKEEDWQYIIANSIIHGNDGVISLAYDPAIAYIFKDEDLIKDIDLWGLWKEILCPVLVLRGESSDILLANVAQEMVESRAGVELVEFEGMAHAPSLMLPAQIHLISHWLDKK